jgi:glycerate-2-kinase
MQDIYQAAIQAVDPVTAVRNRMVHVKDAIFRVGASSANEKEEEDDEACNKYYNLHDYDKIVLVAFGKASAAMATAVVDILSQSSSIAPERIVGLVIVKDGHFTENEATKLQSFNIALREAAHPVPDQRSVDASTELLNLVRRYASPRTLLIACISGGGSALFCAPHPRLSLTDLQTTNTVLLQSGWNIQDMNVVRKRLDQGKGGKLALAAYPSHVLSLVLSDVLGDPLDLIASGPTVPDTSTWSDAWDLVQRLEQDHPSGSLLPKPVWQLLRDGQAGHLDDDSSSPSSSYYYSPLSNHHPVFQQSFTSLVGNNAVSVLAAAKRAKELGYCPVVLGTQIQGEASQVAKVLVAMAEHLRYGPVDYAVTSSLPTALIAGGETTVSLPPPGSGSGKGGRNQELALAAAVAMKSARIRQVVLASVGTDGSDGPTDAAGAVVDGGTVTRLPGSATEALQRHDAYPYLEQQDASGWSPLIKVRFVFR